MYAPAAAGERSARVWAALVAVYLIWGSTFLAIRVALEGFPRSSSLPSLRAPVAAGTRRYAPVGASGLRHAEIRHL